jgi:hypothetical protein
MAKVDGRFPHWVDVYEGERYSIIWFRTKGEPTPQTTAVFPAAAAPAPASVSGAGAGR